MKPYYHDERAGIQIFCGDAREVLPTLEKADLLLTDPPYGIGESNEKNATRINLARPRDYGSYDWDRAPISADLLAAVRARCKWQIIFGGNYYDLPPAQCWLVWDKQNGATDFADCELAWTNLKKAVRIKRHMWHGMIRKGNEERYHPTQKPLEVMGWALKQAPDTVQTILDPFMGSGTTLVAAKQLGRKCVGIELNEAYCAIAVQRLQQECLFGPDEPEPVREMQGSLI